MKTVQSPIQMHSLKKQIECIGDLNFTRKLHANINEWIKRKYYTKIQTFFSNASIAERELQYSNYLKMFSISDLLPTCITKMLNFEKEQKLTFLENW